MEQDYAFLEDLSLSTSFCAPRAQTGRYLTGSSNERNLTVLVVIKTNESKQTLYGSCTLRVMGSWSNCKTYENEFCMQFHFHANQNCFLKNYFRSRFALKQRHKGTRKSPIIHTIFCGLQFQNCSRCLWHFKVTRTFLTRFKI